VTDVDTIRRVARDHDLEFVDLDTYGVDPTAGEILPASLARRHHVVAIKRKFGTPVVATSDPDDFNAQDTVRASIGRDFISVVASRDQIITYLDQLFGPDDDGLVFENFSADGNSNGAGTDESGSLDLVDIDGDQTAVGSADAMETIDFAADAMSTLEDELSTLQAESSVQSTVAFDPPIPEPPSFDSALTASVEELAELARTTQEDQEVREVREDREDREVREDREDREEQEEPSLDTTTQAADFVAEVVATYEEKQQEEQPADSSAGTTSTDAATFPPLARALVEGERVSLDDMQGVLEEHDQTGQSVARILTAQGLVTEADLMWGMAQEMGLEFVDLDIIGLDLSEAGTIPEATARHHNVIVIANDNGVPVVAASNPTDVFAMDDLRTIIGRNFIVVVATRSQIAAYIGRAFNSGDASDMAMEASLGFDGSGPDTSVDDIQAVTEEAPIVRYVNLLILQALNERASDIHIEPTERDLRIRYRIDGVLHDVSTAPRTIAPAVTTRLKVMADMNIAEHRIPQDGRISLNVGSKGIDLRMATLPTIYGEKVVMRVLDKSSVVLGFADLGFEEHLLKTYEGIYTKPYGTILVTGPTGSGKSTTLYTTLTALNSPEKNIITVEDPVELPLKGVNQVQLNLKAGLNFASALRAILRSDPDIVLVGEIRDKETAVIAIEAALTGHMVLATLHTNNAASTPMRLIEMGLEPFLVTSSVSGVLAQRLARRLCAHCKQAYEPTESEFVSAGWKLEEVEAMGGISTVYRAAGCSACANTGYRGRKALAELLPMSEEIERTIIEGGSVEEIHRVGVAQGMTTLRQSGLRKALDGETTIEEVLRVVA
jgi:type IV pilus assembly protein PilB